MTARAAILLGHDDEPQFTRWLLAGAIVLAAHVGLVATYLLLRPPPPPGAPAAPIVIVELAPVPVAPPSPVDLAPGPEMQEAPEPVPTQKVEVQPLAAPVVADLPPLPPLPEAAVVAAPLPPLPEIKPEPVIDPKPPEPKPERKPEPKIEAKPEPKVDPKRPDPKVKPAERRKPAPRTTAPPRFDRKAAAKPAAPSAGAVVSPAALADWRSQVVSQLQRAKRYPSGAESRREQGVVTINFALSRSGGVLSRRVVKSSGHPELDREALAMVQRAAPFPPFPNGMTQASVNLSAPVRFTLR